MKTLRDRWLDQHRHLEPRLDAARESALDAALTSARSAKGAESGRAPAGGGVFDGLRALWREVVRPYRGGWATLAAIWAVLLGGACWEQQPSGSRARLTEAEFASVVSALRDSRSLALDTGEFRREPPAPATPKSDTPPPDARSDSSWSGGRRVAAECC